MRVETISHSTGDQLPLLLDDDGLPIPGPNEFILGRRGLSTNTLVRNLREIAILFRWLRREDIDLWERIDSVRMFTEADVRGGMVESMRREQIQGHKIAKLVVSPHTFNQRLTTLRQFLVWCFDMRIGSIPMDDEKYERMRDHKSRVVKWLDSAFINSPPENRRGRKGLQDKEIEFLIACLDPKNPKSIGRNPAVRYRNYISIMIMLYYGLRPGELLSLRVEDIEIGAISAIRVKRRHSDPMDLRKPRPQIKRNGRVLPIDDSVFARRLDEYIVTWREELEPHAEAESDYLILSDEGEPLSQSALTQLFQRLRSKFPQELPSHLTAKTLRHTFSSKIERTLREAGIEEERRRHVLATLRGDSSLESQSVYVAQEIDDQANLALSRYQRLLIIEDVPW